MSPCACPVCRYVRATEEASAAYDALLDRGLESDMQLAWLRDEVRAVIASPWSVLVRRRLRKAVET